MSALVTPHEPSDPFNAILRQAGAVFASHHGRTVAVNYGSAAGELAVCVSAVGLVDCSELCKLTLEAPPAQLRHLVARLAGGEVAVGGALHAGGTWWCGSAADRVVVLCDPFAGGRLRERLRSQALALHHVALTVQDHSEDWAAMALIGRATPKVLAALGTYGDSGDPRLASPLTAGTVHGVEINWLLESDHRALALVPQTQAGAVWQAIEDAGRPYGISCVGQEAASRYSLLERAGRVAAVAA
jgi:glycine cleavage system aminomethyltransferase T